MYRKYLKFTNASNIIKIYHSSYINKLTLYYIQTNRMNE